MISHLSGNKSEMSDVGGGGAKCLGAESMISFSSLISSFNYVKRQELRIDYAE